MHQVANSKSARSSSAGKAIQPVPAKVEPAALQLTVQEPADLQVDELIALSADFGNQAVNSLIGSGAARSGEITSRPVIQPKLMVGPANDRYEQEADRMAQLVTSMPPSAFAPKNSRKGLIQRQVGEDSLIQRNSAAGFAADETFESNLNRQRGGGSPLPTSLRTDFEPKFGADFSGVRVHTNEQSHQLNQSIQAKAFTTGQDLFFRKGEYDPESRSGQELIAHELTHVVQQSGGEIQRSLATAQEYRTMKTNARKSSTPLSGALSVKNYAKQFADYEAKRNSNNNAGAFKVLIELRKRFTELDNKGDNYWETDELKEEHFRPLEDRLIEEMRIVGEELHVPLDTIDAPEVTPQSSAEQAASLWAHFKKPDERAAMAGIWDREVTLRPRICEVLGAKGDQLKLTTLGYVLESVLPERRQGKGQKAIEWHKSNSEMGLNEYIKDDSNKGLSTNYLDDSARADTQLHFKGGKILKGPEQHALTTDSHCDAVVVSKGTFYSAKKGGSSKGRKVVIQHSSFLSGLPVDTAGMIKVTSGTLEKVDGSSGHYRPTKAHLARLCLAMQARGVNMQSVRIVSMNGGYDGLPAFLAPIESET